MFVRNFYTCMKSVFLKTSINLVSLTGTEYSTSEGYGALNSSGNTGTKGLVIYDGTGSIRGSASITTAGKSGNYAYGLVFGNGSEPVTFDDYNLSGSHVSGLAVTVDASYELLDDGFRVTSTATATNNNDASVTISEVGRFVTTGGYSALVERQLLDTPVTIEAGGVGQITFTSEFHHPTT